MTLRWHVLSRGRDPEHDYQWVAVDEASPPRRERPPRLEPGAAQLVQSEHPSVLVTRVGSELLLFVTALETSRRDVQSRPIRNALAVTGDESDEGLIRALLQLSLRDEGRAALGRALDGAVSETADGGFDVRLERLAPLAMDAASPAPPAELNSRLAPNTEEERRALADQLEAFALPPGQGPLVVVTGAVGAERLEAARLWRGLSRLVKAPMSSPSREVRPPPKKSPAARMEMWILLAALLLIAALRGAC